MKRYYFDLTLDQSYVIATDEKDAIKKIKQLEKDFGLGIEIYDTENLTTEDKE